MKEQIAKTAHSVHLAYCNEMGLKTQPKWNDLELEHQNTILDSVERILSGEIKTKEDSHNNFVKFKKSNGWLFGEIYSLINKTNPRLVDYKNLSLENKVKESLFFECVKSFNKWKKH